MKFFFKKSKYPNVVELKRIILSIKKFNPDSIVAVGGGSVLDYAKIANCISEISNLENQIINSKYKLKKSKQLIAIPTTAGSGAEVTSNAVIYVNKIKYSFEGFELVPDEFIINPKLVLNLNLKLKSSAGFDAISQSIESLISVKSNLKSYNFAVKSLKFSLNSYIDYLKRPNLKNSYDMALAANLSGKAISISKTTAPHAISYPFTSHFSIDHGHAVSLTLNKFLKFNYKNMQHSKCDFSLKNRYKKIFELTKSKNINDLDQFLIKLKKRAGLEDNFEKLGINIDKSMNRILNGVNLMRLKNNPVDLQVKDLTDILKSDSNY